MENFLETNSNENSFLFLTLSNKYFKKCPAMSYCKNSLDNFEYYTKVVDYFYTFYPICSSIEKYSTNESYHLHILIDARVKPDTEFHYQSICHDMIHYAEQHTEQYQNCEWKHSTDKYNNPTISYGPSFKLKIVSTIDNQTEVINYINKYKSDKNELKSNLLNMLITRYCKKDMTRADFMRNQHFKNKKWIDFREHWSSSVFRLCYVDTLSDSLDYINLEKHPTGP